MDWGLFYMEPSYAEEWKRVSRCLNQRNSSLKNGLDPSREVWDVEFAKYGTMVGLSRRRYLDQLQPFVEEIGEYILPSREILTEYEPGWSLDKGLDQVLIEELRKDLKFGFTHSGPHRGELVFKVNGINAKSCLSRGQIKLLVLVLTLAQIKLLIASKKDFGCLLIDDFCTELDSGNLNKLKQYLSDLNLQCFVTAMDRRSIGTLCGINTTLFHVEQGCIKKM